MKIEIYFLNSKLTTEIEKDIVVNDLLLDLKNYFKMKDSNFILFDSNKKQLKNDEIISVKNNITLKTFYLIKSNIIAIPLFEKENELNNKDKKNINELIMQCTGAKKMIDIKKNNLNINNPLNLFQLFDNRNNQEGEINNNNANAFDRLINILQILDENNIRIEHVRQQNNAPVEADEKALRELQDMGFSEDKARQALINSRNDINRATEILLGEGEEEE